MIVEIGKFESRLLRKSEAERDVKNERAHDHMQRILAVKGHCQIYR
jgi:hypothetical protein